MQPDIRWITAGFGTVTMLERTHIGVPKSGRGALQTMAHELHGTSGLVALYVPEGTEEIWHPGDKRGRVIAVVRLLSMPPGRRVEDFFYLDWDGSRRWPIGWPCEAVFAPPDAECPKFREHVEHLHGDGAFRPYVRRFQIGPFRLEPDMQARLGNDFARFEPIDLQSV